MEITLGIAIIAIIGGFVAGFINTLAGNGSAITLTILTEIIGLPGNMANGTNRIGVLAQGLSSVPLFIKNNKTAIRRGWRIIVWIVLGSFLGIWVAVSISNEQFRAAFSYLMIVILIIILVKPSRWLRPTDQNYNLPILIEMVAYLSIGFYAGFIQMGMGIIFLMVTVLMARYDLIDANAIKNIAVTALTIIALIMFHVKGFLDWKVGLTIAIGQATGGWIAARFATRHPKATLWAYRILILVIILAILKLFNLHSYFV